MKRHSPNLRGASRLALALLLATGAALLAAPCLAGDWQITPRLRVGGNYTDNVTIQSDDKEGDFVAQIQPGLSIRGSGARLLMNMDYNLQNLIFAGDSDRNQTNHQFQGDATAELWRDRFFFDANGRVSQQIIDNQGRFTNSNINIGGNRGDTIAWTASPYFVHHFGSFADAQLRYTHTDISNERVGQAANLVNFLGSSTIDSYTLNLNSGRDFARVPWGIAVSSQDIEQGTGAQASFDSIVANVSYRLTRQYSIDVTMGLEDNRFNTAAPTFDGTYWTIGATWTPSQRTEIALAIGERFFGTTISGRAFHRHKRLNVSINYFESPQTLGQQQALQRFVPVEDLAGNPVFDPTASADFDLPTDTASARRGVFILKSLTASAVYTLRRGSISLNANDFNREFQADGVDERITRLNGNWQHDFTSLVSGGVRFTWQMSEFSTQSEKDTRINTGPYLRYRLGPRISGTLDYQYTENNSPRRGLSFTENRISAFLDMSL